MLERKWGTLECSADDDEFYEVYTDQMMQALKAAKERDKGKVSNVHAPQVSFDRLIWSQSGQDQILPIVVKPLSQSWYLLPRAATNLFTTGAKLVRGQD